MTCPRCIAWTQYNRRCKNKASCHNGSRRCASHGGIRGVYAPKSEYFVGLPPVSWNIPSAKISPPSLVANQEIKVTQSLKQPPPVIMPTANQVPAKIALVVANEATAQVTKSLVQIQEVLEQVTGTVNLDNKIDHESVAKTLENLTIEISNADPAISNAQALLTNATLPSDPVAREEIKAAISTAQENLTIVASATSQLKAVKEKSKAWKQPLVPVWGQNHDMKINCASLGTNKEDTPYNRQQDCVIYERCQWNSQTGCHTNNKFTDKALALKAFKQKQR